MVLLVVREQSLALIMIVILVVSLCGLRRRSGKLAGRMLCRWSGSRCRCVGSESLLLPGIEKG